MSEIERKNGEEKPAREWGMILLKMFALALLVGLVVMAVIRKFG